MYFQLCFCLLTEYQKVVTKAEIVTLPSEGFSAGIEEDFIQTHHDFDYSSLDAGQLELVQEVINIVAYQYMYVCMYACMIALLILEFPKITD